MQGVCLSKIPPPWSRRGALAILLAISLSGGIAAPPPARWDALFPQGIQPSWFGPVTCQPALNLHLWRAPIRVPPDGSDLAITLVFRQVPGGFAKVIWQGPGRVVTLCPNLFEQADWLHQRTLVISRGTLGSEGQLYIESTGPEPCLERVDLQWVQRKVFSTDDAPAYLISGGGRWWAEEDLHGEAAAPAADKIHGEFVDGLLEAGPLSLTNGQAARFFSQLQGRPGLARIRAQVSGLGLGEEPLIWVNGSPLGVVAVETPRLDDPGYRQMGPGIWRYGGWRNLTAFVPAGWLRSGENQFDWASPAGGEGVVLRNLRLEVAAEIGASARRTLPTSHEKIPFGQSPGLTPQATARPIPLRSGLSSAHADVGLRPE